MRLQLLSSVFVIMTSTAFASDVSIYKWVDDKGVIHYSHSHPANIKATEIDVRVAYTPSNEDLEAAENSVNDNDLTEDNKKRTALSEKNAKMFEENCKSAHANKKILSNFKKILVQDENGKETLLTGDDITEQLKLTEKHIDIYCEVTK